MTQPDFRILPQLMIDRNENNSGFLASAINHASELFNHSRQTGRANDAYNQLVHAFQSIRVLEAGEFYEQTDWYAFDSYIFRACVINPNAVQTFHQAISGFVQCIRA